MFTPVNLPREVPVCDQVWTGSTNTRSHQLRHPSLQSDGALSLNGVSIAAAAHAGQRNPATGDCHPGTLDRHNAVYILKSPRAQRVGSPQSCPPDMDIVHGSGTPRAPTMRTSVVRTPRGAGLGPEMRSPAKNPSSGPYAPGESAGEDERAAETALLYSPRRGGVPTGKLSKAGSFSALKSFNESLSKGHVDRGGFIDRAFVPAHPNSFHAARIPADYETFAGSVDRWAAGPGGGVEGMRGHAEGHWQDIHAPDTRPFPAPKKTSLELNLKLLPQSITTTEVSSQFLSCGAVRRRPLTARDRYPVATGNTPRKYALRPHTARTRTSHGGSERSASQEGDSPPFQAQKMRGPVPKEPSLAESISAGSTAHTRKALEVMRGAHARPQFAVFPGKRKSGDGTTAWELDIKGEKAIMAERRGDDGLRSKAAEDKENEWGRAAFREEKESRDAGARRDYAADKGSPLVTPRSPRKEDVDYNSHYERSQLYSAKFRPHTARAENHQRKADEKAELQRQKAQEKHEFLNKIDGDIALFSKRSKRPTTAPSAAQRLKQEMHAKMEIRNQFVTKNFRAMDNDHDGVINAKDMAHALDILNVPVSEQEIQELLADQRATGRSGEQGMGFQDYAREYKRLRFPSQNPFEGIDVKIPFWKPNERYTRKWQGEYGKGLEGGGERIRTKLKWRVPIPPQRDVPVRKPRSPRGFVHLENWPMMSTFVPLDPAVPRERPRLQPGEREKYINNWSKRFARNAKIAGE